MDEVFAAWLMSGRWRETSRVERSHPPNDPSFPSVKMNNERNDSRTKEKFAKLSPVRYQLVPAIPVVLGRV